MCTNPIKIAIVDDQSLFRKVLKNFLSSQSNLEVCIESWDVADLASQMKMQMVDILLLDIFLPGISGAEAVKFIRDKYPAVKILAISVSTDVELVCSMLDSGIHGYISKADEPDELLLAIQAISENRIYRNALLTEALYWNRKNTSDARQISLNDREKKILELLWEEKSNREIADELYLGTRTVERIRQDLKEKIGARSTIGLVKYAVRNNIIAVHDTASPAPDPKRAFVAGLAR
jgi:DNA-binding NarL/FixJ family response regulator